MCLSGAHNKLLTARRWVIRSFWILQTRTVLAPFWLLLAHPINKGWPRHNNSRQIMKFPHWISFRTWPSCSLEKILVPLMVLSIKSSTFSYLFSQNLLISICWFYTAYLLVAMQQASINHTPIFSLLWIWEYYNGKTIQKNTFIWLF